jgi:hypothetical protein
MDKPRTPRYFDTPLEWTTTERIGLRDTCDFCKRRRKTMLELWAWITDEKAIAIFICESCVRQKQSRREAIN